ncbi:MAG: hypothetical protein R3C26_26130 [Calditrichia bacterium]
MIILRALFIAGPGLGFLAMYLFGKQDRGQLVTAGILLAISALFFAGVSNFRLIWPVILIIIGIRLIFKTDAITTKCPRHTNKIYELHILHGFASSPKSYKGTYIQQRFRNGKTLHCSGFERIDFEHLTISSQLSIIRELDGFAVRRNYTHRLQLKRIFGGTVCRGLPRVSRLVMMCPAFPVCWQICQTHAAGKS